MNTKRSQQIKLPNLPLDPQRVNEVAKEKRKSGCKSKYVEGLRVGYGTAESKNTRGKDSKDPECQPSPSM